MKASERGGAISITTSIGTFSADFLTSGEVDAIGFNLPVSDLDALLSQHGISNACFKLPHRQGILSAGGEDEKLGS